MTLRIEMYEITVITRIYIKEQPKTIATVNIEYQAAFTFCFTT